MLESMLAGKQVDKNVLIDIDFSRQDIGDTFMTDLAGNQWELVGNDPDCKVVSDSVKGKAFRFKGTTYFRSPLVSRLLLANVSFSLELGIHSDASASGVILGTGNYPSSGGILGGFNLSTGQYPATYIQMFMTNSSGVYQRCLPANTTWANTWDDIIFTRRRNASVFGQVTRNGVITGTNSVGDNPFGNGKDYFCIGANAHILGTSGFKGLISRVKLKLLT